MTAVTRNMGVELARIIAIVLVILFHFFDWGGADDCQSVSLRYVRVLSQSCVDIFVVISGFISVGRKHRLSRYLELWLQVLFTGIVCGLGVCAICRIKPNCADVLKMLLPVTSREYWYFTDYTILFFLMPLLDIDKLSKRTFSIIILVGFFLFCSPHFVRFGDVFNIKGGFSVIWLVYLYLLGAYLARFLSSGLSVSTMFVLVLLIPLLGALMSFVFPIAFGKLFLGYVAPLVVIESSIIVMAMSRIKFKSNTIINLISYFSATTFGVYIWHCQPLFLEHVFRNRFVFLSNNPSGGFLAVILAISFFVLIAFIERLRIFIFRMLRINSFLMNVNLRIKFE